MRERYATDTPPALREWNAREAPAVFNTPPRAPMPSLFPPRVNFGTVEADAPPLRSVPLPRSMPPVSPVRQLSSGGDAFAVQREQQNSSSRSSREPAAEELANVIHQPPAIVHSQMRNRSSSFRMRGNLGTPTQLEDSEENDSDL